MDDTVEEESNEIDELTKIIENKLKLETQINTNLDNIETHFKKEDWKVLKDFTHYFKHGIERVWNIVSNFELLLIISDSNHYPCVIKKGSEIYSQGNIFEGKFFSIYKFLGKVLKLRNFPDLKKIEFIFFLDNAEILKLKISLYKVTKENSCVLRVISKYIPSLGENNTFQISSKWKKEDMLQRIEKMLTNEKSDLFQYESGIIPGRMEDIWDILSDNSKLVSVAPNNRCFVPININNVKVGEVSKVTLNIKGIEGTLEIKLDLKEKEKGWNKWTFVYSILSSKPFKIPRQTVFVQMTKINQNETQLGVYTKIHDVINNEMFNNLSQKKKYVISSLKDYFENFFYNDKI
jgi:hypothetical protein